MGLLKDKVIEDTLDEYAKILETEFNPLVLYVIGSLLEAQLAKDEKRYGQKIEEAKVRGLEAGKALERERIRSWLSQWQGIWDLKDIQLFYGQDMEGQALKENDGR